MSGEIFRDFVARVSAMPKPRILELGTLRWGEKSTHRRALFPADCDYVMSDVQAGPDVDVVADAHRLVEVFGPESFDAVVASSVWEHLERPWIAAEQLLAVLRPGGLAHIQTHFSFTEHGYPHDYYRFTTRALESQFRAGAAETTAYYEFPAYIVPTDNSLPRQNGWLNTNILVKK